MSLSTLTFETDENETIDAIEQALAHTDWDYERDESGGVQCIAATRWGEIGALFAVREEPAALHFSMTLDVKPQATRQSVIGELILSINERLWLGHFDYWIEDHVILFRHTIPLGGRAAPMPTEIHAVMMAGLDAVERFVPAFNFVIWAGKTPAEALAAVMFETDGEA
ncbi:MAG: YbjN domain-containing protein [Pseudomonadota bacterium]